MHDAAIGESVVADEIPHEEVVVVCVDAERRDALLFGILFRVAYDVVRISAMQEVVMYGYAVDSDVIVVGKPLSVNVFVVRIFAVNDCSVSYHLVVFYEDMPLFFVYVRDDGFLVRIAILPLVDVLGAHSGFRLPDYGHNRLEMSCFGKCVLRCTQQPTNGCAVRLYRAHELLSALKPFLIPDLGDNGECDALMVTLSPEIEDVNLKGERVQLECRARAHIEHPFVAFTVNPNTHRIHAFLKSDR